ncbi:MAG TPA: MucR family transcriptional regulator [Caulobacteraceae bacterium]|nr:MucR family transcriptional regulator [Caulobacteraceae bacterium]
MDPKLTALTADIVMAYVEGNKIPADDLAALILRVGETLAEPGLQSTPPEPVHRLTPAQIRKSITPEGITSFEDGKTYRLLKRHLTRRGMTVEDYKAKWGLPEDYPTTAPAYAAKRSAFAKAFGLGVRVRAGAAPTSPRTRGRK